MMNSMMNSPDRRNMRHDGGISVWKEPMGGGPMGGGPMGGGPMSGGHMGGGHMGGGQMGGGPMFDGIRPVLLGAVPPLDPEELNYRYNRMEGALNDRKDHPKNRNDKNDRRDRSGSVRGNDKGAGGAKQEPTIEDFNWRDWSFEEFLDIPPVFLTCHDCNVKVFDAESYVKHIRGLRHKKTMLDLEKKAITEKTEMRDLIRKFENSRAKIEKQEGRCNLCESNVFGSMSGHRSKTYHTALKGFVHKFCSFCTQEFNTRAEFEAHRYGPKHIRSLAFENQTIKVVTENDMLFQEELARLRSTTKKINDNKDVKKDLKKDLKIDLKKDLKVDLKKDAKKPGKIGAKADINNDVSIKKEEKNSAAAASKPASANAAASKDPKAELLNNVVVGDLEKYDKGKVVGEDFLKPVSGFFCRLCKKLLLTTADGVEHMKSKPHWDNCVKAGKGIAAKRKAGEGEPATTNKIQKTE